MAWWQLSITAPKNELDFCESTLLELGALSITYSDANDEPIYEPLPGESPLWSESIITGLFDQSQSLEKLYDQLVFRLPDHLVSSIKQEILKDQVWEKAYLDYFKPMQFGQNLWIIPSWYKPIDPKAINITLDPGVAFGTGSHPTTHLCLLQIDSLNLNNVSVLDYGCGSGILGIACQLKGAKTVTYTDIDPQALESTQKNLEKNQLTFNTKDIVLPEDLNTQPVDLLVANILSGPLIELAETLSTHVKTQGQIILSGILTEQSEMIRKTYSKYFKLNPILEKDGWISVSGIKL